MAEPSLSSPLLSPTQTSNNHHPDVTLTIDSDPGFESRNHQKPNQFESIIPSSVDSESGSQNPFKFLGVDGFLVPPNCTIDPFRNHTFEIEGVYEWVKVVLCLPIALVRLVLFGLALVVGYLATLVALLGWNDGHSPMPKWRSRVMWVTRICARCILFSFGYQWIKRKGRSASRDVAPIVVSNHVSYIEPIFFFYELFPTIVASESHDSIPVVGTIIRAMQVIYVNRFSSVSRKHAIDEIKRKASCNRFPRVLLFPEGTTTNGRVLISFQLGAFIPSYPIQPIAVRYPFVHFDQSWGHISLATLVFRMFTQFHNFMEVEYLPVLQPLENPRENAFHFAERTAHVIATALNVVQTSHAYGDLMILTKAAHSKQENPSAFMVEMAKIKSAYHINTTEAVKFLDMFLSMNPDNNGRVKPLDFFKALRLKPCALSKSIFSFIDAKKNGTVTFKQFLIASACVMKQPSFRRACELAFSNCTIRGNHCISEQEFGDSIRLAIPNMNHEEVSALFEMFDCDHDGRVSEDDFNDCLRRNPLLITIFFPLIRRGLSQASNLMHDEMV